MPLKQKLWKKPKCFRTWPLVEQEESSSSRHQVEQKFLNLPTSTAASASLHHPVRGVERERRTKVLVADNFTAAMQEAILQSKLKLSSNITAEADYDQRHGSRQHAGLLSARRRGRKKVMKIRRTPPHPACPNAECTCPACSDSRASLPQGDGGDQQYQQHQWRYCSTSLHSDHFLGQLVSFT